MKGGDFMNFPRFLCRLGYVVTISWGLLLFAVFPTYDKDFFGILLIPSILWWCMFWAICGLQED